MTKTALVTGSSRGIGRAIALRLAQSGWRIVLHGAKESESLIEAKTLLGDACAGVCVQDLRSQEDGHALWAKATDVSPIHGLVNNAGIYRPHSFIETGDAAFARLTSDIFGVNFLAPLGLTRRACQSFGEQGGGKIVQVASRVGLKGESGASLYSASKAALINLVKALAVEHATKNIAHFAIAPGWVDTAMSRDGMDERLAEALAGIPLGRMATPEDCAHAVNWLMSGEADYMTGLVIDINGASYMR